MAQKAQFPIWLEATTKKSWNLYTRLGWETVGEIVLGKGKVAADGTPSAGGEGVHIFGMIWRPKMESQA